MKMHIEIFTAPNCSRCGKTVDLVRQVIQELHSEKSIKNIDYKKLNVVEEIDYAVQLGVRATPAIVLNGKLEFTATPTKHMLKKQIIGLNEYSAINSLPNNTHNGIPKMKQYRIGDITKKIGLSADTLRYYEKIGLLKNIPRNESGIRVYADKHLSQLKFIQRAQKMNFTLAEISDLLLMREDPQHARAEVRQLSHTKLAEVELRLKDLTTLRDELSLLINLCTGSESGCPIIDNINGNETFGA